MKETGIHFLMVLFLVLFPVSGRGQETLHGYNHLYEDGDTLYRYAITHPNIGCPGTDQVWDFSRTDMIEDDYDFFYSLTDSIIQRFCKNCVLTYRQIQDSLYIMREEQPLCWIDYKTPKLQMAFPLSYGDIIETPLNGRGLYCGHLQMSRSGNISLEVDGEGTLIRAEGDTLRNVLRVYLLETSAIGLDEECRTNASDIAQQEIRESYLWYSEDSRFPLCEVSVTTNYDNLVPYEIYKEAYLYNVKRQRNDEKNKERDSFKKETPYNFDYTVSNRQNQIVIDYQTVESANIHVIIADVMGVAHRKENWISEPGRNQRNIDCSGLRHGQYIVYININGQIYNNVVSIK